MSSSATGRSGPQIGYCHTCDRQVEIDPVSFECNRCHGGFIEIFDIEQQQQQQQQTQQTPGGAQARVIRLNNQVLMRYFYSYSVLVLSLIVFYFVLEFR